MDAVIMPRLLTLMDEGAGDDDGADTDAAKRR